MTYKNIINIITIAVLLTLSFYHLFIYFGRKQELYYLFFSLLGLAFSIHIYSVDLMPHGKWNCVISHFAVLGFISFAIFTIQQLVDFPQSANIIFFFGISLLAILALATLPTLLLGREWYFKYIYIVGLIITIATGFSMITSIIVFLIKLGHWNDPILRLIIIGLLIYASNGLLSGIANATKLKYLGFFGSNYILAGVFYFIFTISLAMKFNLEYKELQKTTSQLQLKKSELVTLNKELDNKVIERTVELINAKDKIEQQEREKTAFYTQLMHHLKTPICIIQEQLEAKAEYGNDESLKLALDNSKQLRNALVNYLTVEAAVNRGESGYNHNLVSDISSIAERVAGCFAGYSLKSEIEPGLKSKVDGEAFCQLVTCLLDNGFRHNGSDVDVEMSLLQKESRALLTVSDNGSGIHKESEPHIFKPFYQLANKRSNRQGIGMGLNHVKLIVDSVGGKIDVDNRVGEGVAFTLSFPLTTDEVTFDKTLELSVADLHDDRIEVSDSDYSTDRSSILIVDDNRGMLFTLKEIFKDYNVFVAQNGRDGLERLKNLTEERKYISLILSDEMMDEMPGFQFIQAVQEIESFKAIPFVFLTARTDFSDLLKGLSYKAVDYILKPFKRDELKLRVASLIEQKESALNDYLDDENRQGDERVLAYCRKKMLTEPQSKYILMLDLGLTPKDIAAKYSTPEKSISHKSVESQIARGYKKLGLSKREELFKLLSEVRNGAIS